MPPLTFAHLLDDLKGELALVHIHGDLARILTPTRNAAVELVGHFNIIRHQRIHVLGEEDVIWMQNQPPVLLNDILIKLFESKPPALILAGCLMPEAMEKIARSYDVAIFSTTYTPSAVIDTLRLYLARHFNRRLIYYGVFMDVLGLGVLITGDPSIGKSELALELITRGHGLIADDAVELTAVGSGLEGRCPDLLRDYIEVRGLGLMNVRAIYGEAACRRRMRLRLVAHLQRPMQGQEAERLPLENQEEEILGYRMRKVILPVAAGRNLAVLLEAAVRTTILQIRGMDSMQEFIERQKNVIDQQNSPRS